MSLIVAVRKTATSDSWSLPHNNVYAIAITSSTSSSEDSSSSSPPTSSSSSSIPSSSSTSPTSTPSSSLSSSPSSNYSFVPARSPWDCKCKINWRKLNQLTSSQKVLNQSYKLLLSLMNNLLVRKIRERRRFCEMFLVNTANMPPLVLRSRSETFSEKSVELKQNFNLQSDSLKFT